VRMSTIGAINANANEAINHTECRNCSSVVARIGQKGKGSPYSIADGSVPELIPVLGSQPAGDVSHKPDGGLPLLTASQARGVREQIFRTNSLPFQ